MALRGTIDAGYQTTLVISVYLISDLIYEISRKKLTMDNIMEGFWRKFWKKNCKKKSTIHSREMGLKTDEQDLKYNLKKKSIACVFARDQLSVIKIYFKESQITLCTNVKGMGDRSRAREGRGSRWVKRERLIGRITRGRNCLSLGSGPITVAPPRQLLYLFPETL